MTSSPTPAVLPDTRALKPCPFCGCVGDIESQPSYSQAANTYDRYRGWCDQCGYGLDWHNYEPDAIAAWNQRATPPASDAAVPAGEGVRYPVTAETLNDIVQPIMDRHAEYMGTEQVFFSRKACANMIIDALAQGAREVRAAAPKVASDTGAGLFDEQAWTEAVRETDRLCYELDITNADHIVLWLEHQLNGHVGPLAYIACRILDAHEAALAADATDGATGGAEVWETLSKAARLLETLSRVTRHRTIDPNVPLGRDIVETAERLAAITTTPGGDLLEQADTYRQALEEIAAAPDAYSESIFAEPDWQKARELLTAGGMTLDAISASNMRFVATRLAAVAEAALSARNQTDEGGEK